MILFKQTDKKFIRMATRGDRNLSTRILNIIISLVETREIIIFSILVERFLSPLVSHQINSFSLRRIIKLGVKNHIYFYN